MTYKVYQCFSPWWENKGVTTGGYSLQQRSSLYGLIHQLYWMFSFSLPQMLVELH